MAPTPPTTYDVTLLRVVEETPKDRTLVFAVPADARAAFRYEPGQYVTFSDVVDGKPRRRSYSFSAAHGVTTPEGAGAFEITVRDSGAFGDHLFHLKPGARLAAMPPRGTFTLHVEPGETLVLTAGGSGVTPFRAYVQALIARGHKDPVRVVHSVRTDDELIFRTTFEAWAAKHPWFRYVPTVTRPADGGAWKGRTGRIDGALLRALWADPARAIVYACGPNPFVDAMLASSAEAGLLPARCRREKWG